jgi:hypothetical protein
MSGTGDDDDKVGYGRPPQHTRFQKGRSGNPAGRPRRRSRETVDVAALLNEPVAIEHKGQSRSMTPYEVGLRQLVRRALSDGNVRASLKLFDLFQHHGLVKPRPAAVESNVLVAPAFYGPDEWHVFHDAYLRTLPTTASAAAPTALPAKRRSR